MRLFLAALSVIFLFLIVGCDDGGHRGHGYRGHAPSHGHGHSRGHRRH